MFDAAVVELRGAGFSIERRDYRFGRITTEAMDVPTIFEPWRRAGETGAFAAEATLGHLRRRAAVRIERETQPDADAQPQEQPADYRLRIEVVIERAQKPTQRLSGTATSRVFAPLEAVPSPWRARGIEDTYWEPMGRDEALESRLLRGIVKRAVTPPKLTRSSAR